MSEKNNIFENDLLMRAILEGGQEEVPAHVWDAVSERLDKVESARPGRTATLWWRRAGFAVAAAAAAMAAVLMIDRSETSDIVPLDLGGDMVAVVEPEVAAAEEVGFETVVSQTSGARLLAYAPKTNSDSADEHIPFETVRHNDSVITSDSEVCETPDAAAVNEKNADVTNDGKKVVNVIINETDTNAGSEEIWNDADWGEEIPERKVKTSVVVSGITGAAGSESSSGNGILKTPSVILTPTKTGIKEKENQTTYNLPISVGAGVKFDFTPRWSLGVGLNYTCLSRTLNGTYTHVAEDGSIDNLITSDIRNSQHYLGIPVNAYYNIVNNDIVNFYTYAGGTVEKCVYDKYLILTGNVVHKEPAKGVQLSANIGVGAEFMLGKHLGLYLDPSLRYYFDCDQPKSIRTAQPLTFGVEVGLRFKL